MMRMVALLGLCLLTTACSTTPGTPSDARANDPWEPLNRKTFAFNEVVDDNLLVPVASTYRDVVPAPLRRVVGNFFGNLADVWSTANHLLQGKPRQGGEMGARVIFNTTLGALGLFDVATPMQLPRQPEDLGQTLGVWGIGNGPYLVLPLLGPSTVRDGTGVAANTWLASPAQLSDSSSGQLGITALQIVDARTAALDTSSFVTAVALDRYTFIRDAYLQRRQSQIDDGRPASHFDDATDAAESAAE
ncbi:MlaA family lipoprotein [Pseudomonas oryzihabitans]|uniref:MlaA family lipoprotein n=1 Tax=Pseudomonas oryzihabitans TaxID=47885 RepID=UPI00135D5696|nr:VacJ family lipoprotein [Pseudomonas oryzihabitans]MXS21560.1 VacJ family lipoprotein [Pseudomonas oryzihabitans]